MQNGNMADWLGGLLGWCMMAGWLAGWLARRQMLSGRMLLSSASRAGLRFRVYLHRLAPTTVPAVPGPLPTQSYPELPSVPTEPSLRAHSASVIYMNFRAPASQQPASRRVQLRQHLQVCGTPPAPPAVVRQRASHHPLPCPHAHRCCLEICNTVGVTRK